MPCSCPGHLPDLLSVRLIQQAVCWRQSEVTVFLLLFFFVLFFICWCVFYALDGIAATPKRSRACSTAKAPRRRSRAGASLRRTSAPTPPERAPLLTWPLVPLLAPRTPPSPCGAAGGSKRGSKAATSTMKLLATSSWAELWRDFPSTSRPLGFCPPTSPRLCRPGCCAVWHRLYSNGEKCHSRSIAIRYSCKCWPC